MTSLNDLSLSDINSLGKPNILAHASKNAVVKAYQLYAIDVKNHTLVFNGKPFKYGRKLTQGQVEKSLYQIVEEDRDYTKDFLDNMGLGNLQEIPDLHTESQFDIKKIQFGFFFHDRMSKPQQQRVLNAFQEYSDLFDSILRYNKRCPRKFEIKLKSTKIFTQKPLAMGPIKTKAADKELTKLEKLELIEHSDSPYASPIVLIRTPNGDWRMCVDYRWLNSITEAMSYTIPKIDEALRKLFGFKVFITLDLLKGFYQIPLHPDAVKYTNFCTHRGTFQFRVLPFGLCNAPRFFQLIIAEAFFKLKEWVDYYCKRHRFRYSN
eukprot:NODE_695_length_4670_cov_0.352439.p1 type:complete len:321 gc:universal NODE_695_length_4670_cov_0.352439:627-1589(+)